MTSPDLTNMTGADLATLDASIQPARVLADAMGLRGAKVGRGDVTDALIRLGLRLVSTDGPDPGPAAAARYAAVTETAPCGCGLDWVRLTDDAAAQQPGGPWWHHGDDRYDDFDGFYRKCPAGNRAPRRS